MSLGFVRVALLDRVAFMSESSDRVLLDLIRRGGPLTVGEMAASLGVTATAIRNRLARLLGAGLVERRPSIRIVADPNTLTASVSRLKSGWVKITRIWPWCCGMR